MGMLTLWYTQNIFNGKWLTRSDQNVFNMRCFTVRKSYSNQIKAMRKFRTNIRHKQWMFRGVIYQEKVQTFTISMKIISFTAVKKPQVKSFLLQFASKFVFITSLSKFTYSIFNSKKIGIVFKIIRKRII